MLKIILFRAQWSSCWGKTCSCISIEKLILKKKCFKRKHFFPLTLWWGNRMFEKGLWECWAEEVLGQFVSPLLKLFVAFLQGQSDERQCIRTVKCTGTSGWNVGGLILPALLVSDVQSNTCVKCGFDHSTLAPEGIKRCLQWAQAGGDAVPGAFPCYPIKRWHSSDGAHKPS